MVLLNDGNKCNPRKVKDPTSTRKDMIERSQEKALMFSSERRILEKTLSGFFFTHSLTMPMRLGPKQTQYQTKPTGWVWFDLPVHRVFSLLKIFMGK